jgi:hypothetical protein
MAKYVYTPAWVVAQRIGHTATAKEVSGSRV